MRSGSEGEGRWEERLGGVEVGETNNSQDEMYVKRIKGKSINTRRLFSKRSIKAWLNKNRKLVNSLDEHK